MKIISILFALFFCIQSQAEEYLGPDLSSWPQTDARKVQNDFAAWLLVTPNIDWQQRWETPPDTIPYFDEAKGVHVGERLVILTFFTNPGVDDSRRSLIKCSLKVTRPDGSPSVPEQHFNCLDGEMVGNPRHIRLSPAIIQFTAEPNDPLGIWLVEVTLEDTVRNVTLSLKTTFEMLGYQ